MSLSKTSLIQYFFYIKKLNQLPFILLKKTNFLLGRPGHECTCQVGKALLDQLLLGLL
jgi:hypothetical protein